MWDVVDKGIQPDTNWAGVTGEGGQEQENRRGADVVLLDAQTINVYQVLRASTTFTADGNNVTEFCPYPPILPSSPPPSLNLVSSQ